MAESLSHASPECMRQLSAMAREERQHGPMVHLLKEQGILATKLSEKERETRA
jgi:hypothetical protein